MRKKKIQYGEWGLLTRIRHFKKIPLFITSLLFFITLGIPISILFTCGRFIRAWTMTQEEKDKTKEGFIDGEFNELQFVMSPGTK